MSDLALAKGLWALYGKEQYEETRYVSAYWNCMICGQMQGPQVCVCVFQRENSSKQWHVAGRKCLCHR